MILADGLDLADLRGWNDWRAEKLDAEAWTAEMDAARATENSEQRTENSNP